MATVTTNIFFEWNDSYSVGNQAMDKQHRQLIALLNSLHEAMRAGKGGDVLGGVLDGLIDYTQRHFHSEEQLLAIHGYPELAAHKVQHRTFVDQALRLQQEFRAGELMISLEVMSFLKDWLINHIMGTDKEYTPFLRAG